MGLFLVAERLALMRAVHHRAFEFLAFAGAAGAVLAAVGQAETLADAGAEHGLAGLHGKGATARLNGNLECHLFGILGAVLYL